MGNKSSRPGGTTTSSTNSHPNTTIHNHDNTSLTSSSNASTATISSSSSSNNHHSTQHANTINHNQHSTGSSGNPSSNIHSSHSSNINSSSNNTNNNYPIDYGSDILNETLNGSSSSSSGSRPIGVRKAVLDDFVMLKTVGKGSFGKVVMVRKKDDQRIYAMKILKKEMVLKRRQYEHTLSERRILENIDHPFIVSLRFAFQTEHKLYMVFDFFNGGELYHYLSEGGKFGEERARFYAAEIISALDYLHQRGIVYRDLKPENLILDAQGHIRITDFGLSKENVEGDTITSICGTPEYLAPEILRKRPYGIAVDWWSLGTLLFEMIAGLPPFYDRNRPAMYKKILEAPLIPPPDMSPEAVDLCSKMLIREPTARLGYRGAEEIKRHPFFATLDWNKLERKEYTPPWVPRVIDETDTRNIASEFTNEPPMVTPSPAGSRLRDMTGATPPSFTDFTFTHSSILDGNTYRVSISEEDTNDRDGLRSAGIIPNNNQHNRNSSQGNSSEISSNDGRTGSNALDRSGDVSGDEGVMGQMEGLRI